MTVGPDIAAPSPGVAVRRTLGAASPRYGEKAIMAVLAACAALSIAVTTAIVVTLVLPSIAFFREVPIGEFLTGTTWQPAFSNAAFGVLPIVVGTLMVTAIALVVAVPVGLCCAVYLSEYAGPRARKVIKPVLEILEGIPTVATGLFALLFLRPFAEDVLPFLPWGGLFSLLIAGIGVGLIIVPLVSSVADDALRAVPPGLREGAYALGGNKFKVTVRVVFPAALSGVIAAIVLGMSRAIGETMIVLIAAGGGNPNLSFDIFGSVQTMTAFIGRTATGDISQGTIKYDTIFAVGTLLFVMTLAINVVAIRLVRRFREVYE
ncbi:MAG: phosphate ABC transporter permease subunit PstC [Acidimicrobiales bacterium]